MPQLVSGIEHLHANGIIHEDLKPANVLIDETGCAKIGDFGVFTRLRNPHATSLGMCLTSCSLQPCTCLGGWDCNG